MIFPKVEEGFSMSEGGLNGSDQQLTGQAARRHQRAAAILTSFQRVIYEEDVPFDDLEHSTVFAGLLPAAANSVRA